MPLLSGKNGKQRIEVSISQCVHYCGFRYGHGEYHPYETYVTRLHRREPIGDIRREFVDFLLHYRPRDFGQALGTPLSRPYPLWVYPWANFWTFLRPHRCAGWHRDPSRIPDIIAHFSDAGIPQSHIDKEYGWLQRAYEGVAREGYKPEKYGYPLARVLQGLEGRTAFLVLDGNHRISALSALGQASLELEYIPGHVVAAEDARRWPGVRTGFYSEEDAVKLFEAYFLGNTRFRTLGSAVPPILN